MRKVLIDMHTTSAWRIEERSAELHRMAASMSSPKDVAACKRHIVALEKLLRHPRSQYNLGKGKILGGGGKRASLGEVEWSDMTKKKAPKKASQTSSRKGRGNKSKSTHFVV